MARQKRIDFPGAWHHVMHRGARRAPIFKLTDDCRGFLDVVREVVGRFGVEVHAYALMPNHYHLLVRSALGNLSEAMQYLNGTYTLWLNARHRWDGPVFRGRFRNQLVADEEHLRILVAYIHLNPVEAHLARRVTDEAWTSHRAYAGLDDPPTWLTTRFFLDLFGGAEKLGEFVRGYRQGVMEYPEDFNPETGLFEKQKDTAPGPLARVPAITRRAGRQPPSHARNRPTEEVLQEVMALTGATMAELKRTEMGPRANPARRFAIWALCHSGTLSQREVGKVLDASHEQVARLLGRLRKDGANEPMAGWMKEWQAREEDYVSSAGV